MNDYLQNEKVEPHRAWGVCTHSWTLQSMLSIFFSVSSSKCQDYIEVFWSLSVALCSTEHNVDDQKIFHHNTYSPSPFLRLLPHEIFHTAFHTSTTTNACIAASPAMIMPHGVVWFAVFRRNSTISTMWFFYTMAIMMECRDGNDANVKWLYYD